MTMLLEPPVRHWACPSCQMEAETVTSNLRMHACRGLNGLTVSMVEVPKAGTMPHARHRVLERQDYCADADRVMSVATDYPDGRNDCTVYPITARFDASALTPGHSASTVGGSITVTPGTAGVGVANFRRPVIHDPITARMYQLARRSGARMAWSASGAFAYAMLQLASKAGQNLSSDTYKTALYTSSATPDKTVTTAALTEYNGAASQWVTGNEVSSTNYSAGGTAVTPTALSQTTNVVTFTSSGSPSWSVVTFTTYGCLVYDSQSGQNNVGLSFNYFGGIQEVTVGNFAISWNASGILTITT